MGLSSREQRQNLQFFIVQLGQNLSSGIAEKMNTKLTFEEVVSPHEINQHFNKSWSRYHCVLLT